MRRSQVALEFVIFISLAILLLIIVIPFAINKSNDINQDKRYVKLIDLAEYIEKEIYLASVVEDGYSRKFQIPSFIDKQQLRIEQNETYVKIATEKESRIFRIPKISGTLKIGENLIQKRGGVIYVS